MPIFLFGTEEQKREWLPDLASGRKLAAFGLTEPGRRLRRRRDADARRPARRAVGRERLEDLHHERRHGHHLLRHDHGAHRRGRDLEPHRPERHAGLRDLGADGQDRLARVGHARALVQRLRGPRGEPARPARRGVPAVPRDPRRRPDLGRGDGRRPRAGRLRARVRLRAASGSSSAADLDASRPCSSSSPTWRRRSRPAAQLVYKAAWLKDQGRPFAQRGGDGEALHGRALEPRRRTTPSRSTAATATWTSTRSRASTATRRCSRSARARTRCSAW